ncbi:Eco57I restriction-modification methylase domain-containing protein [Patescibacteria group bacterium]|nr:N-6 DNA methylase [Candidatus Falkowbacteria bacterium]MBU3906217.1 Eco57I restriction-modification methylase domain-containing protein [Patescibacteria group bacterium]MBU4015379.1 Eco57I restriction-modification methylase domain-containing protein [Patescibacteria group bacterium]MBU4026812.1 Eco57I restriction-modification methylase domain-containing protein [Patescibacteria group bacterium]MBU4073320.1 Eco57I restriction-modification methylase domain-containing protein [Patescibacteria g
METKEILQNIIDNFDLQRLKRFFSEKNSKFRPSEENFGFYNTDNFSDGLKLGELALDDGALLVCAFKAKQELSERSGKKSQYELGKKILKEAQSDAGIFIYYNQAGNFRFSLIYANYLGRKRDWSAFRRFTYFVSSDLTNKTFKHQIGEGDFSTLEKIKDAFSVEKVTKEFFGEISSWYFWAVKNITFPEDAEKDENGRYSIGVIRLITRMIFIWFMKEKKLIPDYLFNENKVKEFLKDLSAEKTIYYKAVLQNLFFATLNTPIKKRGFRESENFQGKNKDFMNHSIYRYEDYFRDQKEILKFFMDIPFLNGGLFECLDKGTEKNSEKKYLRIDGFSDRKDNILKIPNFLFFSEEMKIDLNSDYGTKNKKYKCRGLINILQSYNFTIDENTPFDEEVALDPELLGLVFENLLASYNPETSTTARKATGSYYTPRKIVDYMVDESLKAYLKNKLPEDAKIDDKLNNLFSYSEESHKFNNSEVDALIKAINILKVIDPAVGSGAFPMGILQKLVFVLSKLDPHNKKWKQEQIDAVENNVSDAVLKKELIKKIESNFENNNLDYGRKLYLIQNCIYGVDIQITAIQISKLRFFISLLVDEKSDESRENFGIEPLPNLETKFVAANSLIGLHSSGAVMLPDPRILKLEEELKKIRAKHFNANYKSEKEKLRKKDKEIRLQLAELFEQSGFPSDNTEKIINWDPYSPNTSADFFDSEWMFGVNGFDIVIANPPYVRHEQIKNQKQALQKTGYEVYNSTSDLYTYFYELSYKILNEKGISVFISSNKWMRAKYGEKLRKFFQDKTKVLRLIDFGGHKVFETATVDTNIMQFMKEKPPDDYKINFVNVSDDFKKENILDYFEKQRQAILQKDLGVSGWTLADEKVLDLKKKIEKAGTPLKNWDVKIYRGITTGLNEIFVIDGNIKDKLVEEDKKSMEILKPILRGKDVNRWYYTHRNYWLIYAYSGIDIKKYPAIYEYLSKYKKQLQEVWEAKYGKKKWYELRGCDYYKEFEKEKIVWAEISEHSKFTFDDKNFFGLAKVFIMSNTKNDKYLLAILNSKLGDYAIKKFYAPFLGNKASEFKKEWVQKLPIPKISPEQQKPFINLVDQILKKKKDNPEADTGELEREIDEMVYELYGLGEGEIKIIKQSF